MNAVAYALPPQPLLGTDVSAFVLLLLGGLYAALWARDREPGLPWLALSFVLLGLWWATTRWHLPSSPALLFSPWTLLLPAGVASMMVGLVRYLHLPGQVRRRAQVALLVLPGMAGMAILATAFVALPRAVLAPLVTLDLMFAAGLTFWARKFEPGAGHAMVALGLLTVPATNVLVMSLGAEVVLVRYIGGLPLIFFGMLLLTVSLLRRRRALEAEVQRRAQAEAALAAVNAGLEATVRDRTAELREVVAGLESFNRSVSHDLRGPLGGIAQVAALAEQALQRGDTAAVQRMLPVMREQSERSQALVAALLTLARVGDAPLQRQTVDLGALAREACAELQAARPADAAVSVRIGALPSAEADPVLLRAVFVNLLGNALKFSGGKAERWVEVTAELGPAAVTVHVTDNGAGFDEEVATRLFNPFQRLHGARFEGHGVGLSIVRRAVERHGGRVWAQGRPDAGATFSFSLPQPTKA